MSREKVPLSFNSALETSIESVFVPMESEEQESEFEPDKHFCTLCKQEIEMGSRQDSYAFIPHNLMQCLKFFLGEK